MHYTYINDELDLAKEHQARIGRGVAFGYEIAVDEDDEKFMFIPYEFRRKKYKARLYVNFEVERKKRLERVGKITGKRPRPLN